MIFRRGETGKIKGLETFFFSFLCSFNEMKDTTLIQTFFKRKKKKKRFSFAHSQLDLRLFSGQILIKNWNPLAIGTVSENRSVTVQEVLGDLMNVAILKIQISKINAEDKRSAHFLKAMMPLIGGGDGREKLVRRSSSPRRSSSSFEFQLINRFYSTMHDDTEDDDDVQHQSSSSKPTTSPNGYSYTSSNSNTNDG